MEEMMRLYAMNGMGMGAFPVDAKLTVNVASPLIAKLAEMPDERKEQTARYLFELAQLSQRKFTAEELQKFLSDSYSILNLI